MSVPIGTVIAFSGTFGGPDNRYPINAQTGEPDMHWVLCDGQETNGIQVPDLRGRFILGASTDYPLNSVGGSLEHSHEFSGTVGETSLTEAQLASHIHDYLGYNEPVDRSYPGSWGGAGHRNTAATGENEPHTHRLDFECFKSEILPPYYAFAFCIRIH